ncbi:PREDICTED: uncharacterized protein LOC104771944 [Camelina sativa]|uniref:Uncharacterized protein LOC104771944 n=1 Tax=Camelina sativa TaxID=90675 RepID=A0ABM0Y3H5_CAMSA|nr:PREDICTED: uncharacterized protein LOC104771944 [Camelina sativa]XP_010494869.1 PREDICTED: uncharacterized protein LOC104771944 [Camelina sativa]XP_010494870.1 PREDICTED: uncharacterized protein LOC104771944 [Camelina sativa]XP_010494871.1 PREDICTED: uncharacterized protein LOC104771944 [Camelina sativa]XP_010494872.1 PREDICTED: uncharacterized protein LOC104771944 [Camelina sativa]XP_010494873.1 PREDICTED: uncharacterized protein LOC104771944 [Camelina sativa]
MNQVAKKHEEKVQVEFTRLGEHVGKGSVTLSSFLGPLAREHIPYTLSDWRHLDEQTKYTLWEEIQARFDVSKDWQKDCIFKQMGSTWRASKSKLLTKVRSAKSKQHVLNLKPDNIQSVTAWTNWVKSRTSTSFKAVSEKYRTLRWNQIPHTTSRKGLVCLAHEMKKKSSDPSKVTRSQVWVAGHTHADGRPFKPEFEVVIEKIKTIDSQMDTTSSIRDDVVSQVLGKDKSGRVRGMGRGITATKLAFIEARDTHVEKLEATQAELLSQVQDLQNVVHGLAAGKRLDDSCNTESSTVNIGGPQCQLLEWYSKVEVVVGEAEFCSADPMYNIGRISLGPNAAAVTVKSVSNKETSLWRLTPTMTSLGDAVGCKVAWPFSKIILDNMDSPDGIKTASSSAPNALDDMILIFDWNSEDELIAEGSLVSTDPKELVNNITLGPNSAIVKVCKVVKKDAFLWRPSVDKSLMGDVLEENIAWPIHKIQLIQPQSGNEPAVSKNSSPKSTSVSLSNNTNTINGGKTKCILLDCSGTREKVAEGRVCSTNPSYVVHFVPLGANATKVWVEVSKVGDAPVWRPNSEIEIIADALGTIVAWPNDKIVFI